MKTVGLAIAILLLSACGTTPAAGTSPNPRTVVALLQSSDASKPDSFDSVVVVGLDGKVLASATFTPLPTPNLGCMGAVLPRQAYVSAGKVFFADGKGAVRSLAIDGTVTTVATFPLTSTQQMFSFAVSPDGGQLLGTVFTMPAKPNLACGGTPGTGYTFDVYSASAGSSATLLNHESLSPGDAVMAFTGWGATGPVGSYPSVWASQGGGPGSTLGVLVHVDPATGRPGPRLSDPTKCLVWETVPSGAFVCTGNGVVKNGGTVEAPVSVRNPDGSVSWQFTISGMNGPTSPHLSPDASKVIMCCSDDSHEWLIGRDGSRTKLGAAFYGGGWVDATTVIGEYHPDPLAQPPLPLSHVALNSPNVVVPMGLKGLFVGPVRN